MTPCTECSECSEAGRVEPALYVCQWQQAPDMEIRTEPLCEAHMNELHQLMTPYLLDCDGWVQAREIGETPQNP